jgi:hypothetical protein
MAERWQTSVGFDYPSAGVGIRKSFNISLTAIWKVNLKVEFRLPTNCGCPSVAALWQQKTFHRRGSEKLSLNLVRPIHIADRGGEEVGDRTAARLCENVVIMYTA